MKKKDKTLILAPLLGFTDATFRNVYMNHFSGMDEAVAPFISTMGEHRLKPSRIKDVAPEHNQKLSVVPQILGNVAEDFIFLADHLHKMGHAVVNWNMGCPHSKIAKKQRGSGLLLYPKKIDELLTRIIPTMKPDLSVKIRLGRRNKDEIYRLLEIFDRHDLTEIILHPRTGTQMYKGASDHDAFEKALAATRHPMVYNGDITDMASFLRVKDRFPTIHRFMIGRGILSNPFLPEEIKGIDTQEDNARRLERLRNFMADLMEAYAHVFSGPGHLTDRMKGFWSYLGPSFEDHKKPLKQILKSTSKEIYIERVNAFFDSEPVFSPEANQ